MAASGSVWFDLADGTSVTVEGDDLRLIYEGLWALSDFPGAVSTAALLVHESDRHPSHRRPIGLNGQQTVALRRALDRFADPS